MMLSQYQNAWQSHEMEIGNGFFQNAEEFKYLGRTVTNETLIEEEIKRTLNGSNACYQSFQNLLSFCLLSGNVKFRIYKTIMLPVVLYGCEAWCLTLMEEHSVRSLRRIFDPRRDGVIGGLENYVMRNVVTRTLGQV
jgi:hypothetical protein